MQSTTNATPEPASVPGGGAVSVDVLLPIGATTTEGLVLIHVPVTAEHYYHASAFGQMWSREHNPIALALTCATSDRWFVTCWGMQCYPGTGELGKPKIAYLTPSTVARALGEFRNDDTRTPLQIALWMPESEVPNAL